MAVVLGTGAYGNVVKEGRFALKRCKVDYIQNDPDGWMGVARELHCGGFNHRHICKRHGVVSKLFRIVIRMELGKPLDVMNAHPEKLLCQIGSALQFLHAQCIMHRDVKPDNIIVVRDVYKLIDFGLSRPESKGTDCLTDYTVTRYWRPPELLNGSNKYDGKCDVWSLGCVYYHAVHKKMPFAGNATQMMAAIQRFQPDGILQHLLVPADKRFTSNELMVHLGREPYKRRVRLLPRAYQKCKVPRMPRNVRRVMDQYHFKTMKEMTCVAILATLVCGFDGDATKLVRHICAHYNMTQTEVFEELVECKKI